MGFAFLAAPLMLNVLAIFAVAVVFNGLFPWRRYPAALVRSAPADLPPAGDYGAISHEDFVYALSQLDSFIDVSEDDVMRIYSLATGRHRDLLTQAAAAAPVSPSGTS